VWNIFAKKKMVTLSGGAVVRWSISAFCLLGRRLQTGLGKTQNRPNEMKNKMGRREGEMNLPPLSLFAPLQCPWFACPWFSKG
jgi:hypothetical protein